MGFSYAPFLPHEGTPGISPGITPGITPDAADPSDLRRQVA